MPGLLLEAGNPVTSLSTLGDVFEQIITWFTQFVGMISAEPLLLIGLACTVVAICIRLAFKAIHGRG